MKRFVKLIRIEDSPYMADMLASHHNEFILLTVIAMRARRSSDTCSLTGLNQNEARIGDYKNYGMSERNYRTAKTNLNKWNFATFKATNRGTVATLCECGVYDINCEPTDGLAVAQPTGKRRANDDKEECKNERSKLYDDFLSRFNEVTGKRFRVLGDKVKRQLNARLKEGFTIDEILGATGTCKADPHHIENPKYLTPEFITRLDKLQKYAQGETGDLFTPFTQTSQRIDGEPLCNGLTREQFIEKHGRVS